MKIAVTCIQLLRDIDAWRPSFDAFDLELVLPDIAGQHLEGSDLVSALEGCVGVVAGDDRFTSEVLGQLPDLVVISKWGSGIDGIDLDAAERLGITVTNTPGMFDEEVADYAFAMVIMLACHLSEVNNGINRGGWPKPPGTSLSDATLGIVGLGGIGRAVARRATTSSMNVVGTDPSPESCKAAAELGVHIVSLDELLAQSDFISINCPLVPSTKNLFNDRTLAQTMTGVRIVNTGRGGVIETAALVRALDRGHVGGAALDVLDVEPIPADHPLVGRPNVVLGSHNASNTLEASARVHAVAIDNLLSELRQRSLL